MKLFKDTNPSGPLCKDCKYCGDYGYGSFICERPRGISLVNGEPIRLRRVCMEERKVNWLDSVIFGFCGKSGRYFEKKESDNDI